MSLTDPVADFLARIRNAIRARHQKLDVPASKLKTEIARILKEEGYIANYKTQEEDGKLILRVYLKYGGQEAAIRDLARISRPGCRVYIGRDEIKRVQGGLGISIMTTPQGRDDRSPGTPRRRWRRDSLRSLVGQHSLSSARLSASLCRVDEVG